ncbi:MAG TPA: peptide ABC transporter substrate-binding protein [Candidatus Cybelea sp.]|jgi:peptide/nickel transport system substrate-binding protein|nr:peptide ABC transporter substrate-binding protein [Candidatus Cybelea sp.]
MRSATLLGIAALTLFSVPACSKSAGSSAAPSDRLRIAIPISPTQLNPILGQNTIEGFVDGLIFNFLVTHDQHHRQVPDLAATVPSLTNGGISRDGMTITYHLRHGVKWQDGAPFTSGDVKFTWQAIMNSSNNVVSRRGYDQIASVDTPDNYTVVMHMKRLFPPAVDTIFAESDTPITVLPAHLLAKLPDLNHVAFNAAPIGTGPYEFVSWQRGDHIALRANPSYFLGAPSIKNLTVAIIPDDNTTVAQLQTHEVGLGIEITSDSYRDITGAPGVERQLAESPTYTAIDFNVQRPPLDDVRVRQALVFGLDRATIVRDDTYGTAQLAVADLAPYYWAFDTTLHPTPYDPARAKALLDAAGWRLGPDGVRVRDGKRLSLLLVYGLGSQSVRTITAQTQQMYRELGIEVELKGFDYATLYAAAESGGILNGGKFDLAMYAWVSGSDPDDSSQWTCGMIPPAGNNVTRYCSPEMEAAQRLALSTFDQATRKRAYAQVERLLLHDAPAAFMYYQNLRYAHAAGLENFMPNGISEGWNAQEWRL